MKVLSIHCILQNANDFNGCDVRNMMELFVMLKLLINPPETHNHSVFVAGICDLITFQCKLFCLIMNISSNFAQMVMGPKSAAVHFECDDLSTLESSIALHLDY